MGAGASVETLKILEDINKILETGRPHVQVHTLRWACPKPNPSKNYAGLVIYDLGNEGDRSKWQKRWLDRGLGPLQPGVCYMAEVANNDYRSNVGDVITEPDWAAVGGGNRNQPHRPLCFKIFGYNFIEMQQRFGVVMGGFAIQGREFLANSGAFNTGEFDAANKKHLKDGHKWMTESEAKLVAGSFLVNIRKCWPRSTGSHVTREDALAASTGMVYESKVRPGSDHLTYFIRNVYG